MRFRRNPSHFWKMEAPSRSMSWVRTIRLTSLESASMRLVYAQNVGIRVGAINAISGSASDISWGRCIRDQGGPLRISFNEPISCVLKKAAISSIGGQWLVIEREWDWMMRFEIDETCWETTEMSKELENQEIGASFSRGGWLIREVD